MKKQNKFICAICCMLLLSLFISQAPVFAAESVESRSVSLLSSNALSLLTAIQSDTDSNDEAKVRQIVTLLFDIKRDQFENRDLADFDFSVFGNADTATGADLLYFSRSVKAEKDTITIYGNTVTDCNTELTFDSVIIDGNSAKVNVYEWLTYYYCSPEGEKADTISGVGVDYEIELQKNNNGWKIVGIDFYNEATESLRDNNISVSAFIQDRYETATSSVIAKSSEVTTFGMTEATLSDRNSFISFSDVLSCTYGCLYGGNKRNSNFPDFSNYGGDCQNFASQCVWYGLGGEFSSISSGGLPMINNTLGNSTGRSWYVLPDGSHSASWTSVTSFYNHVLFGGFPHLGLCGTIYSGIANAELGDIIQICDSSGTYYHSYVVVNAYGETGSRTLSDIYISAHTTDRFNQPLSDLMSSSANLRTISITGAWTP